MTNRKERKEAEQRKCEESLRRAEEYLRTKEVTDGDAEASIKTVKAQAEKAFNDGRSIYAAAGTFGDQQRWLRSWPPN
jgi:hypothetical protein